VSDIERALRALGARLDDEPARDLVPAVSARLDRPRRRRVPHRRALAIALAALLLAAATALAASPALRHQARSWLRSVGISTSVSDRASTAPIVGLDRAGLGAPIAPSRAAARLGLRALPRPFGRPARVFAARRIITMFWPPGADRPASAVRGVGALLTIARSADSADPQLLAKVLSSTTTVEFVPLANADGGNALWIAGVPHAVSAFDGPTLRFRLAAKVLVWRIGALVYRLEGSFPRDAAVAAARRAIG